MTNKRFDRTHRGIPIMLNTLKTVLIILLISSFPGFSAPGSFQEAKKIARSIFNGHRETLYCGCQYNQFQEVNLDTCNMQAASPYKRAHRIEWEHMMGATRGRVINCFHS